MYYQQFQTQSKTPIEILQDNKFVGCIQAESDLSANYKPLVQRLVQERNVYRWNDRNSFENQHRSDRFVLTALLSLGKCDRFGAAYNFWEPFGITRFYTDAGGAYQRHLHPAFQTISKTHTQTIERKHLTLRRRIKRLARKTICFSKSQWLHDAVIGLVINRYKFGLDI